MPKVFLSSTFWEKGHKENPLRGAFLDVVAEQEAEGLCWDYNAEFPDEEAQHGFRDLLRCVEGVRSSDIVAVLIAGRRGSGIHLVSEAEKDHAVTSRASFFEIEVFAAAALAKPVVLFFDPRFEPDPEFVTVLRVLLTDGADVFCIKGAEQDLLASWKLLLEGRLPTPATRLGPMVAAWAGQRSRSRREDEVLRPKLGFIDLSQAGGEVNIRSARNILDGLAAPPPMEREPGHIGKLVLLWSAWRDLAAAPPQDEEAGRLCFEVLGRWAQSASWFGLHAHLPLGALAAANEQRVRTMYAGSGDIWRELSLRHPDHARASAQYSIARHSRFPRLQYLTAMDLVTRLGPTSDAFEQARSVRAKAAMQLAQLDWRRDGWRLAEAYADLRAAVRYRRRFPADAFAYGDSLTELGVYEAKVSRGLFGIDRIRDGIEIMREAAGSRPSSEQHGFLARAHRALATVAPGKRNDDLRQEAQHQALRHVQISESLDQGRLL